MMMEHVTRMLVQYIRGTFPAGSEAITASSLLVVRPALTPFQIDYDNYVAS